MLPAPDRRQQGAGHVVPDTEHRAGDGGHRTEVRHSQGHGQPGILHADFEGHGSAKARRSVPQSRSPIPERQAQRVMQDHGQHDQAGHVELIVIQPDDDPDDPGDDDH